MADPKGFLKHGREVASRREVAERVNDWDEVYPDGIGRALLDWAGRRTLADGLRRLRLDCAKTNAALQGYYRSLGFRHVRTVDLPHRASGALFERPAGAFGGYGGPRIIDLSADLSVERRKG